MGSITYGALWLFIFVLPWEGVIRFGGVSIVSRASGALALGICVLTVVISGKVRRWHPLHFAALAFVLCAGLGFLFQGGPAQKVTNKYYTFVQLFAMIWMIWEVAKTPRRLQGLTLAYVFGAYAAAIATLVLFRHEAAELRRFAVGGIDPNDLAMKLALAVPMAWYLSGVYQKPWLRLLCRAYLPVGLLALTLTGSRGGLIVAFVALSIIPLSMDRLTAGRLVTALAILMLTGILAAAFVPDVVVHRLATTSNEVESASFGGRFRLWMAGLRAFTYKPLLGYSTGGFIAAIYPQLGAESLVAHNSFISVLVEEGLIGLILYCLMLYAAVAAVMKLPRRERRFGQVLLASLFLAMSPLTWEDVKPVWFILAVVVGLSQVLRAAPVGRVLAEPLRARQPLARRPAEEIAAHRGEGGA
jgi:hypothetical protein